MALGGGGGQSRGYIETEVKYYHFINWQCPFSAEDNRIVKLSRACSSDGDSVKLIIQPLYCPVCNLCLSVRRVYTITRPIMIIIIIINSQIAISVIPEDSFHYRISTLVYSRRLIIFHSLLSLEVSFNKASQLLSLSIPCFMLAHIYPGSSLCLHQHQTQTRTIRGLQITEIDKSNRPLCCG